jgi:hypothetical protein
MVFFCQQVNAEGITRFESVFGPVNTKYYAAGHLLGIVNAMNIDDATDQVTTRLFVLFVVTKGVFVHKGTTRKHMATHESIGRRKRTI